MSFRITLAKYFTNHAETRDRHKDPALQTRYYKTTKNKGLKFLEDFFTKSNKYEFNSISQDYGEISVLQKKGRKVFIIITIVMVRPFNTAIDFLVTTESFIPIDFGYSNRLITRLYKELNHELQLVE